MTWDLVGARMKGEDPLSKKDIFRYGYEVEGCGIVATDNIFSFLDDSRLFLNTVCSYIWFSFYLLAIC